MNDPETYFQACARIGDLDRELRMLQKTCDRLRGTVDRQVLVIHDLQAKISRVDVFGAPYPPDETLRVRNCAFVSDPSRGYTVGGQATPKPTKADLLARIEALEKRTRVNVEDIVRPTKEEILVRLEALEAWRKG